MRLFFDCRYVRSERHDGISRYSTELVRALAELHPVTMIVHDPRQLRMLPDLPHVFASAPTSAREPFIARQLNRLRPDVVFSPMQTMGSIGRRYGLVLTIHDLIYYSERTPPGEFSPALRLLWRLYHLSYTPQRLLLRGADRVATISATTRELMRRHRIAPRPVRVVGNAPDERFRLPAGQRPPGPPERPNLVYMGSFMPYKNVETAAAAMHELPGWTLQLCSRIDDARLARLERLAPPGAIVAHRGVSDERYLELLHGATALVTASRNEGFGLPLIEAMAAGCPVLCSDLPIFREVCGPAGRYFPAEDPAALAAAARALADPAQRRDAQEAGLAQARGFTWRAAAESLLATCREVHADRRCAERGRDG
ncbi:MAG: glycosyltransferase family 1 protein [Pseudoclavibacter sp.]|nr:glycosyltransferase family 1 protein [Pseudoclavibacter sp.]